MGNLTFKVAEGQTLQLPDSGTVQSNSDSQTCDGQLDRLWKGRNLPEYRHYLPDFVDQSIILK